MSDDTQRLIMQISDLRRQMSDMHQVGTVHEVKGTKMRMLMGKDKDGKEILSPWLNTSNMRGGAREQRFYKKGQTLSLVCPGGDIAQGMIAPYAPNKGFKTPEHADGSGQDEESYQQDDYRGKTTKEGHDHWLQPEEKEQQQSGGQSGGQGGGGGGKQQQKGHVGGDKAVMKSRMHKDGGHTLRIGKDVRVASHKDGAKLRAGSDWVVVKKGQIIFSQPPILGKDPIPNDDK
jgi:hypothetical protein